MGSRKGANNMQVIDLEELVASLKKPTLKIVQEAVDKAVNKFEDDSLYVKKATACRMLDCDGKTFNEHFAKKLDIYYLGDSKIKRYRRKDVENLGNKVSV